MSVELLQGNEACALAAIRAGVRFYGGYPITPSSEIAEVMSRELPKVGGVFIQMEDEIGSLAACIGARLAGKKSMTATSGPGFSLMQEHLGYAAMAEVPVVIVNAMRGGPSTGLPTKTSQGDFMQARWGTHGDHPVIAIVPESVHEVYHLTIKAVNLSEMFRVPVVLLMDETLSHLREKVEIPEEIEVYEAKPIDLPPDKFLPFAEGTEKFVSLPPYGTGYRYHITGLAHGPDGFPTNDPEVIVKNMDRFLKKFEGAEDKVTDFETVNTDGELDILLVAAGSVARPCKEALNWAREQGIKVGLFRPRIIWPFPEKHLKEFDGKVKHVIVVEQNQGQLIHEVEKLFKKTPVHSVVRYDGELVTPFEVEEGIRKVAL